MSLSDEARVRVHHSPHCPQLHAGTDEGGFAWLTLNYLLGHLGQSNSDTVAAIDLVGAIESARWFLGT